MEDHLGADTMKNHAYIIKILEAGTVSHETLEEYVGELVFRLEQQLVERREARQFLRLQIAGWEYEVKMLRRDLQAERLSGDSITRLRFLENHVIDLNERINAAAKEAFMDGRARGRNEGIEEGLKRAADFHRGKEIGLLTAKVDPYPLGFAVEFSAPQPPAPGTKVMVGDLPAVFVEPHKNGKDWWIHFGPRIGLWAYHPSDVKVKT